jgi:hypothetical protein
MRHARPHPAVTVEHRSESPSSISPDSARPVRGHAAAVGLLALRQLTREGGVRRGVGQGKTRRCHRCRRARLSQKWFNSSTSTASVVTTKATVRVRLEAPHPQQAGPRVRVLGGDTLRQIARELVETVRRNTTIDWNLRETARARLRVIVKRTLRKYGYPPTSRSAPPTPSSNKPASFPMTGPPPSPPSTALNPGTATRHRPIRVELPSPGGRGTEGEDRQSDRRRSPRYRIIDEDRAAVLADLHTLATSIGDA